MSYLKPGGAAVLALYALLMWYGFLRPGDGEEAAEPPRPIEVSVHPMDDPEALTDERYEPLLAVWAEVSERVGANGVAYAPPAGAFDGFWDFFVPRTGWSAP